MSSKKTKKVALYFYHIYPIILIHHDTLAYGFIGIFLFCSLNGKEFLLIKVRKGNIKDVSPLFILPFYKIRPATLPNHINAIDTVSYTHLDVYKRQAHLHHRLCGFAAARKGFATRSARLYSNIKSKILTIKKYGARHL